MSLQEHAGSSSSTAMGGLLAERMGGAHQRPAAACRSPLMKVVAAGLAARREPEDPRPLSVRRLVELLHRLVLQVLVDQLERIASTIAQ
jgi:hypothetical protein